MKQTVTVSNGTEFYQIPVSDLVDATSDGFYLPISRQCTIVADGQSVFEIPYSDLAEAEAHGFRDIVANEAKTVVNVCRVLHPGANLKPLLSSVATEPASLSRRANQADSGRIGDQANQESANSDASTLPPAFVYAEHRPQSKLQSWDASRFVFGTAYPSGLCLDDSVECDDLQASDIEVAADDEESEEEPAGLARFVPGSRVRRLLATNSAIHVLTILLLALIALPARPSNFALDATIVEPSKFDDPVLQEIELRPDPVPNDQVLAQVPEEHALVDQLSAILEDVEVDPGFSDVSILQAEPQPEARLTTPISTATTAARKGEFAGRSSASRQAKLQQFGGTAASEAAVLAGLKWLQRHQNSDGSWSFDHRRVGCDCSFSGTAVTCNMGATGLALMAFLGAGHTPHEGEFRHNVRRGVLYLLSNAKKTANGIDLRGRSAMDVGTQTGGMYVHGIATTALCEALGMSKHSYRTSMDPRREFDRRLRPVASGAVRFILNAQNNQNGSWGYVPGISGDTSIVGWQVMALVSASHIGIAVPKNAERGITRFLDLVQSEYGSRYGYMDRNPRASTTSIGLLCRMLLGWVRSDPRLKAGVEYLAAIGPANNSMYYNFYATQVLHQYGGKLWKQWNPVMRDHLVSTQSKNGHEDGSWLPADVHGAGPGGRHYMTCLAVMTLEVYYRHMPIYKREVTLATKPDDKGTNAAE